MHPAPASGTAYSLISVGVLLFVSSLPLAYRKVPMNRWYGFRIPASFRSETQWYDVNACGGRLLARWSLLILASGLVGLFLPATALAAYYWASVGIVLLCVLAPVLQILIWASRQSKV